MLKYILMTAPLLAICAVAGAQEQKPMPRPMEGKPPMHGGMPGHQPMGQGVGMPVGPSGSMDVPPPHMNGMTMDEGMKGPMGGQPPMGGKPGIPGGMGMGQRPSKIPSGSMAGVPQDGPRAGMPLMDQEVGERPLKMPQVKPQYAPQGQMPMPPAGAQGGQGQ